MYKCQDCNYQCSLNSELTKHINGMHGIKVYKCNFCGEEYKWEYSLKHHMKKHEGYNGEIGLPTKAYTPGTGRKAVNEDNVVTNGEQKSCTSDSDEELEKRVSAKMKEFNRKIELGGKLKLNVEKIGYNENIFEWENDMKEALKT